MVIPSEGRDRSKPREIIVIRRKWRHALDVRLFGLTSRDAGFDCEVPRSARNDVVGEHESFYGIQCMVALL